MKKSEEDTKRKAECLERWHKNKKIRRAIAIQVMQGKRRGPPPGTWKFYDIQAEITLIEAERAEVRRLSELAAKEKAAREKAKEAMRY